jgi:hypothetical protein
MDFKKPRVALYYDVIPQTGYRNDGANLFLSYNYRKLLDGDDPAQNPDVMGKDSGNFVHLSPLLPTVQHGSFDLNLLVDYGEDGLGLPLDWTIPHPNAYWIADSHLGYDYRLKRSREFDHVFASHKPSIEKLVADGIPREKIHYMPWAAEPTCYRPFPIMEKYDWCFIGFMNNPFRIELVDRFVKEWPLGTNGYLGWRYPQFPQKNVLEDAAKVYCQSRVVLNEAVQDDLNMRVFEALSCRRLLLTEDIPAVRDHFKDNEHLILFKTVEEAVAKAKFILKDDGFRNYVAEKGHEEFLSKHTYRHRALEILKTCLDYEPKEDTHADSLSLSH